jgi:hypothetical protein
MGALTPGPEDAEKKYNGADNLANSTHSPKTIPLTGQRPRLLVTTGCKLMLAGAQPPGSAH